MEETQQVKSYYNRITIISDDRIDVTELAKATKKFGTVVSVSSSENRHLWDE